MRSGCLADMPQQCIAPKQPCPTILKPKFSIGVSAMLRCKYLPLGNIGETSEGYRTHVLRAARSTEVASGLA
jgi:hypothetical protein